MEKFPKTMGGRPLTSKTTKTKFLFHVFYAVRNKKNKPDKIDANRRTWKFLLQYRSNHLRNGTEKNFIQVLYNLF